MSGEFDYSKGSAADLCVFEEVEFVDIAEAVLRLYGDHGKIV